MTEECNACPPGTPELRLILLGSIGCGKTLSGDTLLGQCSTASGSRCPRTCQLRQGVSEEGRKLVLVEAPRWYWSGGRLESSVRQETVRALSLSEPGPHAFLVLIPVGEFMDIERRVPGELEETFGAGALRHALVLFTCGDYLMGKTAEEYLAGEDAGLREVVKQCGGRYHVFNNRRPQDRSQVLTLLDKLERMARENGGCYVSSALKRQVDGVDGAMGAEKEERAFLAEGEAQPEEAVKVRHVGNGLPQELSQQLPQQLPQEIPQEIPQQLPQEIPQEMSQQLSQEIPQELPQEIPQQLPQEIPQELPQEIPQELPQEIPQQLPQELPQEIPQQLPQEIPQELPQEIPQEIPQELSQQLPQEIPQQLPQAIPQKLPQEIPQELPQEIPQQLPQEIPQQLPQELPQEIPQQLPQEIPQKLPQEIPQEIPQQLPQEIPQKLPQEIPQELPQEIPQELPQEIPQQLPQEIPQQLPQELPQEIPQQLPQEIPQELPQEIPQEIPQELSQQLPKEIPQQLPQELSQQLPQEIPQEIPQQIPQELPQEIPQQLPQEIPQVLPQEIPQELTHELPQELSQLLPQELPAPLQHALPPGTSEEPPSSPLRRCPSFRLTEEGTLLSLMTEMKLDQNLIKTCLHHISSPESPSSPTSSPPSFPSSSSQSSELRLVLLGRTGAGKSAAGNMILGREEFVSRGNGAAAVTQACEKKKGKVAGKRVAVVDTPDWFCSELPAEDVRRQVSNCVALSAPGPHAFLLCVPVNQPAELELQALGALEAVFGRDAVLRHTLVLFTHGDRLPEGGGTMEDYIVTRRKDLLQLVERCGDRHHVLERGGGGGAGGREANVGELLEKVEQTVRESGEPHYSCSLFQEAESRVRQRQEEILRERRERERERGGAEERARAQARETESCFASASSSLYPVQEMEEEEQAREEAENSVRDLKVDTLPSLSTSTSPSFFRSAWDRVVAGARSIPKLVAGAALLGGVVGVFFGGLLGGVVGATAGSVATEVGRRKYTQKYKTE